MAKISCVSCVYNAVCKYMEEYVIFFDETMKEPFDLMPDFLDIYVCCKYYKETGLTPRKLED